MLSSRDTAAASMDLKRTDIPEKWIAGLKPSPPVLNPTETPTHSFILSPGVPSSVGREAEMRESGRKGGGVGRENVWTGRGKGGARPRKRGLRLRKNGVRAEKRGVKQEKRGRRRETEIREKGEAENGSNGKGSRT